MKLTIRIRMDNAAFVPDWSIEAARILQRAAQRLDELARGDSLPLVDYNGNVVGEVKVSQ